MEHVEQRHRDHGADLLQGPYSANSEVSEIRAGKLDGHRHVQAFARFERELMEPPETDNGPMQPINADAPAYFGHPCWLWHRLWEAGPQIGFWDRENRWWKISKGEVDSTGMIEKDGAWGVGTFPSHWSSLNHVPLNNRILGWERP